MTLADQARLYSPELLGLAVELARYPIAGASQYTGSARSRTCGSKIDLSLDTDPDGRVAQAGMRVSACAIGQAAAAIFAAGAKGKARTDILAARQAIEDWMTGGNLPDWPGFAALAPAQGYPGRHGAILLAWNAALEALPISVSSG